VNAEQGNPRISLKTLQEIETKVSQPPRSPSPKKMASIREKSDGGAAILTPEEAGRILNEICSRVQHSLRAACLQAQKQEQQMQIHASVLDELTKDVEDGLSDLLHIREKRVETGVVPGEGRENSFLHTFEKAREESMGKSVHKMLQLAAAEVAGSAREVRAMHSHFNSEAFQVAARVKMIQQYLDFRNSISWHKISPGMLKSHERRIYTLEADLLARQQQVDTLHGELRLRSEDLDARELQVATQMARQGNLTQLKSDHEVHVQHRHALRKQLDSQLEQRVRTSEEAIKTQQQTLKTKSDDVLELQHRLSKTEETLHRKTLELQHLETELRENVTKLAAAEVFVKDKMDQAADAEAKARAKGLSAQAMMDELEDMLVALEGKQLSAIGTVRRTRRMLQLEAAVGVDAGLALVSSSLTGGGGGGSTAGGSGGKRNISSSDVRGEERAYENDAEFAYEWTARLQKRERMLMEQEADVALVRAKLAISSNELDTARSELLHRHSEASHLRAELSTLVLDTRSRDQQAQETSSHIEQVLALLETIVCTHHQLSSSISPQEPREPEKTRERERRGGHSQSPRKSPGHARMTSSARSLSPAPRLLTSVTNLSRRIVSANLPEFGASVSLEGPRTGTWVQRVQYVQDSCQNVVQMLRTQQQRLHSKNAEWEQRLVQLQQQVASRDEAIRELSAQLRHQVATLSHDDEQRKRERDERMQEQRHEWEREREQGRVQHESALQESRLRESEAKLEHGRREDHLQSRITALEAAIENDILRNQSETGALKSEFAAERQALAKQRRDLEVLHASQQQETASREKLLQSTLQEKQSEMLHQQRSLEQVNADLAHNWTSVRTKQQALSAQEDNLATARRDLQRDVLALQQKQELLHQREKRVEAQETLVGQAQLRTAHLRSGLCVCMSLSTHLSHLITQVSFDVLAHG